MELATSCYACPLQTLCCRQVVAVAQSPYRLQTHAHWSDIPANAWDALLARQDQPTPFMRHAYLQALQVSDSASPEAGWVAQPLTLWEGSTLVAACPFYLKSHSYGEYVFDWAWARAYQQHGLAYYPKGLVAVPFTPASGSRLLARDDASRRALLRALKAHSRALDLSSTHILFMSPADRAACLAEGWLERDTVQFHWHNAAYRNFEDFLGQLSQDKRKKIRQERRRVASAGVTFRVRQGREIGEADWDFFYRCYTRTYHEHGNPPYLTRAFFTDLARTQPQSWVMFVAERAGEPIAASLIAVEGLGQPASVAYGRYWGAVQRVDCLHFEACYYQPLVWCIANGVGRFEGGAQGEHKMARALLPQSTHSAHDLVHPEFADAVSRFLERERAGVEAYVEELQAHSPFKQTSLP